MARATKKPTNKKAAAWRLTFLRAYRKKAGKTLEEVAEKMGLTHGQLSKIERGGQPYSQHVLEVAAKEYGTTVAAILTRPPDAADIFTEIETLTDEEKQQALRVVRALRQAG